MTRVGKIARLPRAVREEINARLENGEPGRALLAWLNGREDVQAVLKAQFKGRAINKQNLSEWRLGGFQDWRKQQHVVDMARDLMEQAEEMREITQGRFLSDAVADMAALSLARALRAADELQDPMAQCRAVVALVPAVVRLRASDREYEQAQREAEIHRRQWTVDDGQSLENGERRMEGTEPSSGHAAVGAGQTRSGLTDLPAPSPAAVRIASDTNAPDKGAIASPFLSYDILRGAAAGFPRLHFHARPPRPNRRVARGKMTATNSRHSQPENARDRHGDGPTQGQSERTESGVVAALQCPG